MTATRYIKMLLLMAALLGLIPLMALPSSSTHAQGPPTPTNIPNATPGNGEGGGRERPATPMPPGADLAGFVYDYSRGSPQPGITVLLDGGGWQAQTVSDSNGNYQFVNLGSGEAVLNLVLPPGVHAAAPNWPVSFVSGGHVRVNLGYYGGDVPPMPVLLSSRLEGNALLVQVENRTGAAATGGLVDIRLPVSLRASPGVQASQGAVDYSEHRVRLVVGELAPGATVSMRTPLEKVGTAKRRAMETAPTDDVAALSVARRGMETASADDVAALSLARSDTTDDVAALSVARRDRETASADDVVALSLARSDTRGPGLASPLIETASSQIEVLFTYDQQITPQLVAVDLEEVAPVSQQETLMPVTGGGLAVGGLLGMGLAIALLLALAGAGWSGLKKKRVE